MPDGKAEMKEYRCRKCHKILFKMKDNCVGVCIEDIDEKSMVVESCALEIKCNKCKIMNNFGNLAFRNAKDGVVYDGLVRN